LLAEERLLGIECALPEPDAYAKSAVLLSGLFAAGPTAVSEPLLSPDHLERMLTALGLPLRREGPIAVLDPARWNGRVPALGQLELPGAVSAAACAAAAASVIPNSRIALRDVCSNPTRSGFFDALRLLAARHAVIAKGDRAGREPVAELQVAHATPRGGVLGGEVVLRALDCLPALCLLGARSARGITIADAEAFAPAGASIWSDLAAVVRAFSVDCTIAGAGLRIEPAARVLPAQVDAADDCRLALTAVLFGLAADGETLVDNAACLSDEIPGSIELLQRLGARIELHATDAGASHRGDT
jgi:3-phosphoshikimate 1-carboxyvinyltransferase